MFYKSDKPYVRFEGSEGWIYVEYPNILKAEPESLLSSDIGKQDLQLPRIPEKRDFLDAIQGKGEVMADAEVGHHTASMCHLGQIAVQLGRRLTWDPKAERFTDDDEANAMVSHSGGIPTYQK